MQKLKSALSYGGNTISHSRMGDSKTIDGRLPLPVMGFANMKGLSPARLFGEGKTIHRWTFSYWTYSDSLMPFDPKKSQHGSISPHKGALGF